MTEESVTDSGPFDPPAGSLSEGFTVSWVEAPGWPRTEGRFVPVGVWLPDPYWPAAPEDWAFWQVSGSMSTVAVFEGPLTLFAADPDPVWVPAPGWVQPPSGWTPPEGWSADPRWPRSPAHWQFWRQPPRDDDPDRRTQVATRADRLNELNQLERVRLQLARTSAEIQGPAVKAQVANISNLMTRRRLAIKARTSVNAAVEGAMASRDTLLAAIRNDVAPNDTYFAWRRELASRLGALDASSAEMAAEVTRSVAVRTTGTAGTWVPAGPQRRGRSWGASSSGVPWQQAEHLAASALRSMGHRDARVTGGGSDGGLDVVGRSIAAQVKYTSKPVGRPVLQQLVGAAGERAAACFAASGFSGPAVEFADRRQIALFTVRLPGTVRPVNRAAKRMVRF